MAIKINDLSLAVMLLESDFSELKQGFKEVKLKDFDDQLKCRCSSVFFNQLIDFKKLIENCKLSVIKENFKSCVVPLDLQEGDCELGFVKERVEEVNTLVRQKLDKLAGRIDACDSSLTALCSLIDFHIECYAIKGRLAELLSIDPAEMNQAELEQLSRELKELEQSHKQWSKPRSKPLRKHLLTCPGIDKGDFVQVLSDLRFKCTVELVLGGLKNGQNVKERFADFPAEVQWKIFASAGRVREKEFPATSAYILDYVMHTGKAVPEALARTIGPKEAHLRSTLDKQAVLLFICSETAFVACVDVLKGYVKEEYCREAAVIQEKLQGPARFRLLKELIEYNMKSGNPEVHIRKLLEQAEEKGLNVQGAAGVYFWVWFFAHRQDSNAGGPDFGKENAHKDLARLLSAIDEASTTPELLLQRYGSMSISSPDELKGELEKIKEHSLSAEQREEIVCACLTAGASGGILFDKPDGIHYWVWKIASDAGEPTLGDNWGGDNAPKNIDRLLAAINRAS